MRYLEPIQTGFVYRSHPDWRSGDPFGVGALNATLRDEFAILIEFLSSGPAERAGLVGKLLPVYLHFHDIRDSASLRRFLFSAEKEIYQTTLMFSIEMVF